MPYTPENNPYIPGDPYSYDLKWLVRKLKENITNIEGLSNTIEMLEKAIEGLGTAKSPAAAFDTVEDMKNSHDLKTGMFAQTMGYHSVNDKGGAFYIIRSEEPTGYYENVGELYAELIYDELNVKTVGAYGDDSHDDTEILQKILNTTYNNRVIVFPQGFYKTSATLHLHPNSNRLIIEGNNAQIKVYHTGDGISFNQSNNELGFITINNLRIIGPNPSYGALSQKVSIGAGLHLSAAYHNKINNVHANGFRYGLLLNQGIGNTFENDCYFRFNEYGIYLSGNATNQNRFTNCTVRENWINGVRITRDGATNPPLANVFNGCLIESNKPYVSADIDQDSNSIGVYLSQTYENVFTGCYFENQLTTFLFDFQCADNKITDCYACNNGASSNIFRFLRNQNRNNQITNFVQGSSNQGETIRIDAEDIEMSTNVFTNCVGFKVAVETLPANKPKLINFTLNSGNFGSYSTNSILGRTQLNIGSDTSHDYVAYISDNGTDHAVLHTNNIGLVEFGTLLLPNTTITDIKGGFVPGNIFVVATFTNTPVTIKHNTSTSGHIYLRNKQDAVMNDFNQMIMFVVDPLGNLREISRNF